jgi:poly(3-hydroxybutyrate) depolymerase
MKQSRISGLLVLALTALPLGALVSSLLAQSVDTREPIRRTLTFHGTEREYFVQLPREFDRKKSYWPLVVIHGGGGNGRTFFLATGISRVVAEVGFDAIVISPSFPNDDDNASRFPNVARR